MCHHLDARDWEALRDEVLEPEPTEPTDEAEPTDEPELDGREPLAPTADD